MIPPGIEERQPEPRPEDWPADHYPMRSACEACLRIFIGNPNRTLCRRCDYDTKETNGTRFSKEI